MTLTNCAGGQDGTPARGSALPISSGIAGLALDLPSRACRELDDPTAPATAHGVVLWRDAQGRDIGRTDIDAQSLDLRGGIVHATATSTVLQGQSISFRLPADVTTCGNGPAAKVLPFTSGRVTSWAK
jgi:hypothetical protein